MRQIVSLSGGKDSTCMLLMMLDRGEQVDDIVFFDWGKEYPQMYEHLVKLERYIGRAITRIYPQYSWEYYRDEYVLRKGKHKGQVGYGKPQWMIRWCTYLKRKALEKYCKDAITCIGYPFQEKRRAKYPPNQRYPLLEWGVCSSEALKYCYNMGFDWEGLYQLSDRISCSICPFRSKAEKEMKQAGASITFPEAILKGGLKWLKSK